MGYETNEQKLSRLKQELARLKSTLPEHCSGTESYVGTHAASAAHWLKIEEIEEEIKKLEAELGH